MVVPWVATEYSAATFFYLKLVKSEEIGVERRTEETLREGTPSNNHLGLGLFIVRLIAEFHHGTINMVSMPNDNSVVVRVSLPY